MFAPFQEDKNKGREKIIVASMVFHISIIILVIVGAILTPREEIKKIPIFEMVQLPPPPPQVAPPPPPPPPQVEPDVPPKPVKKKKPEPPKEKKPKEKPKEKPPETPPDTIPPKLEMPPAPPNNSPISTAQISRLQTVGSVMMDPLLQEYLERVVAILMTNFKPPQGVDISLGSGSRVSFTIQRSGRITGIMLKQSSGNGNWDRLGVRSVKISRLPPLPFNYRAPALQLFFDFKKDR